MQGGRFGSLGFLIVPTTVANRVASTWSVNPLWIHVDEAVDDAVVDLLSDVQRLRSMTRSWLRILVQEKCANVAGQQSIVILSTASGLPLPVIVMYSIPDELGLSMPDASDTAIIPVSNTFHQWLTYADAGGRLP